MSIPLVSYYNSAANAAESFRVNCKKKLKKINFAKITDPFFAFVNSISKASYALGSRLYEVKDLSKEIPTDALYSLVRNVLQTASFIISQTPLLYRIGRPLGDLVNGVARAFFLDKIFGQPVIAFTLRTRLMWVAVIPYALYDMAKSGKVFENVALVAEACMRIFLTLLSTGAGTLLQNAILNYALLPLGLIVSVAALRRAKQNHQEIKSYQEKLAHENSEYSEDQIKQIKSGSTILEKTNLSGSKTALQKRVTDLIRVKKVNRIAEIVSVVSLALLVPLVFSPALPVLAPLGVGLLAVVSLMQLGAMFADRWSLLSLEKAVSENRPDIVRKINNKFIATAVIGLAVSALGMYLLSRVSIPRSLADHF